MVTTHSLIERIYNAIKDDLCTGAVLPGQRVNVAAYCERFGASKSPVRNALNRLVGEGLLEAHVNDGFYRPRVTEQILNDMFLWSEHALAFAFDVVEALTEGTFTVPPLPDAQGDLVSETENLFAGVAMLSGNFACQRTVANLNDQLRSIRRREDDQITDRAAELSALMEAWRDGDLVMLRAGVGSYHALRIACVRQIVALAYRDQQA